MFGKVKYYAMDSIPIIDQYCNLKCILNTNDTKMGYCKYCKSSSAVLNLCRIALCLSLERFVMPSRPLLSGGSAPFSSSPPFLQVALPFCLRGTDVGKGWCGVGGACLGMRIAAWQALFATLMQTCSCSTVGNIVLLENSVPM